MRRFLAALLLTGLISWVGPAMANLTRLETIDEASSGAALVVAAKIESSTPRFYGGTECGSEYQASVQTVLKTAGAFRGFKKRIVSFGQAPGLDVGGVYLLFLQSGANAEQRYERLQKKIENESPTIQRAFRELPKKKALELLSCGGMDRGLQFDSTFAWPIQNGNVEIFGLWEVSDVPKLRSVGSQTGPVWILNAEEVFHYITSRAR